MAVRLALTEAQRERLTSPPTASRLLLTSSGKPQALLDAAPATARKLQEVIAVVAQQFGGYIFNVRETEVRRWLRLTAFQVSFTNSKLRYLQQGTTCSSVSHDTLRFTSPGDGPLECGAV